MAKVVKQHEHEKREITFVEFGALLGTQALLEGGYIGHTGERELQPGCHLFNMAMQGKAAECGTIACIGGTMAFIMGLNPLEYVGSGCNRGGTHSHTLTTLFYPLGDGYDWDHITPDDAVRAIKNWRRTGNPGWNAIMRDRRKANANNE